MMEETQGIILDIKKYAIHDGPGIRTTIFLKGCPLDCWWCHNPEGKKFEIEQNLSKNNSFHSHKLLSFNPSPSKNIGQKVTVKQVLKEVTKDRIFYEESNGGVTYSGGEPLAQPSFLLGLLVGSKKQGLHTVVDTSGFAAPEIIDRISKFIDLFLYDLKLATPKKHQKYVGESNELIINNLKRLSRKEKNIIIRIPVIPTINDTEEEIIALSEIIYNLPYHHQVDLLPYHSIAANKYQQLNLENKMKDILPPSKGKMAKIKKLFHEQGLTVHIEE
jgi:pyruvate formate lyase activating enzyme